MKVHQLKCSHTYTLIVTMANNSAVGIIKVIGLQPRQKKLSKLYIQYIQYVLLVMGALLRLMCFHGSSVLFYCHFCPPLAFLSHSLCVFTCSPLFSHQSLQGMLSSLHSELDIQRYLMKIQLPRRVSQTFLYLICIVPLCLCVAVFASSLTSAL